MFYNYNNFLNSSHFREKLYKGLSSSKVLDIYSNWQINEVKIMFLLSNHLINKPLFLALLVLLEKMSFNNFSFVLSKRTIANFNIKRHLKIGALFTLRGFEKDQFLRLLTLYSVKKLDNSAVFYNTSYKNFRVSIMNQSISMGIQRVLFLGGIAINTRDYELLSPLFENMLYGLHIYFYSPFRNFYLNRLLLSQYGIVIV